MANITPLFFVETLADIEKTAEGERTPEQVVGNLAEKTPTSGAPNVHHDTLCFNELFYARTIKMEGRIIVEGGKQFVDGERRGVVMQQSPEVEALHRWRNGQFLWIERALAKAWRQALSVLDLDAVARRGKGIIERMGRPRDLAEAKAIAATLLEKPGSRDTREALGAFPWPETSRREAVKRWNDRNAPLRTFAPYTAHVLTVDLFFSIALGAGLIGHDRPSNKIDIAYLYYLPFCHVFTSSDTLHKKTAHLFMNQAQAFAWGQDLKVDLARLDTHYDAFPDDVKERGVISFAPYPPTEGGFLISALWDKVMRPDWRKHATQPYPRMTPEAEQQLIVQLERMVQTARTAGPEDQFTSDEADALLVEHQVPVRKGKWRIIPPEVEGGAHEREHVG